MDNWFADPRRNQSCPRFGNTTKLTDPAGNWKRYTSDVFGNLTKVEEPNPAYGQADNTSTNFVTTYT